MCVQSFHFHTSALVRVMIRGKESKMISRLKWKNLTGRGYVSLSKEIMSSKQITMINYCPVSFYDSATNFTMQRFHFNDINYYKVFFFFPKCLFMFVWILSELEFRESVNVSKTPKEKKSIFCRWETLKKNSLWTIPYYLLFYDHHAA